jgi:hypothetical protein
VLVKIYQRFRVRLEPGQVLRMKSAITLSPGEPIWATVQAR